YYPGWRAFVDGKESEVLRADFMFRAVSLEEGPHTVRLLYDSWSFKIGAMISSASVVAGAALLVLALRVPKRGA
ncbi:MAG: YfhO family protein, partial [Rudaea sp.]